MGEGFEKRVIAALMEASGRKWPPPSADRPAPAHVVRLADVLGEGAAVRPEGRPRGPEAEGGP